MKKFLGSLKTFFLKRVSGVSGKGFLVERFSPKSQRFLEVRNLFLKKVPRRKVFGKSENLFSKKGFRKKINFFSLFLVG
ncbi:MAG: hypothetical protein D6805_03690 [Planctomycetota bacterium]|nr:MAG: hypothetical protein D6805_03690 [Planctomycetota bacterium]